LTISGPPKSLELLFDSNAFTGLKTHKVDIHAPYHASHLYDYTDVESIISKSNFEILETGNSNIPILSSATGEVFPASEHTPLLRLILEEILLQPIRWDLVLGNCVESLKSSDISHCDVFSTATNNANSLASALREASIFSVVVNVGKTIGSEPDICGLHPGRQDQSKIAIIGLSGRFPEAPNLESFWSLLHQGLDVHKVVPTDRFDIKTHFDSTGKRKNTSQTPYGCFINEPGLFDARFFNMSPKEASQSDPGQRLALLTACEALEMAGFVPDRTPSSQRDRVGIFYGMTSDDWREVNSGQDVSTYFIPGGNRAFTPGRINYHFKFSGPSVSVDTACSSSLAAIHMACNSLWRNDCDTAIAGGTNVMTNPDNFAGLDKGHFLSRTGNCKTFDDGADGYCRADGVGSVIMKRLEDAQADGDPIQGVIVGAYTNHSAEAESITRPNIGAQSFIFDKVLNDAGVEPMSISYIEMHGTGTQAGDFVEMKSVLDVFASGPNKRSPQRPLYLGSAKSNIGHGESASGVTSLIKVLLMMKENEIPPHCGIKTKINHRFPADLEQRGIRIAKKPIPWQRDGGTRRVFLNNFSAAGGNTALLLEDAPATDDSPLPEDPRTFHMVAVSAKTIPSLTKNLRNLAAFTVLNPDMSLPDLSYTTTARRIHHDFRVIISGTSLDMISKGLETAALRRDFNLRRSSKVAFAFTGQGSQYIGMGKQLFSSFSQFRSDIQHFDKICLRSGFPSIQKLIDGSSQVDVLNPSTLQLGLTCLQMALARLWISWGVKPTFVIGHSLGEYAALNIAGVLSVHDTIYLTGKRAQLLQEKCTPGTHSMLAIKASVPFVNKLSSNHKFEYACINGPDQVVIGGLTSGIEEVSEKLAKSGIKYRTLEVPFAFHSSQVNPILEEFESVARGIRFQKPKIPLISPLLAAVITDEKINATYLSRHCREVVDFVGALEAAKNSSLVDNTIWIEIGPDPIVTSMVKTILGPSVCTIPSLRKTEDASKVLTGSLSTLYLARVDIHWDEYHRDFSHKVLQLPVYSWDLKNYWIQYVHDWCLTKGDAPSQPPVSTLVATAPRLSTTTVQKIIEENFEDDEATVTIESDISRPDLKAVFQAHRVNGVALWPTVSVLQYLEDKVLTAN
jgi:naphtho-gamma-pyrone polyketide synthase